MSLTFELSESQLEALSRRPSQALAGSISGAAFRSFVGIANYPGHIRRHYASACADLSLAELNEKSGGAVLHENFGLIVEFGQPVELLVHDDEENLVPGLRQLMAAFGPLIFRNARLRSELQENVQKNIFPSLRFHTDRGRNQHNQISLFTQDPRDEEQMEPRLSSTLFVANVVAWLEFHHRSKGGVRAAEASLRSSFDLFEGQNIRDAIGRIILEQPWKAPRGTGEICLMDNRQVLHASYHHTMSGKGWRIGARYLV